MAAWHNKLRSLLFQNRPQPRDHLRNMVDRLGRYRCSTKALDEHPEKQSAVLAGIIYDSAHAWCSILHFIGGTTNSKEMMLSICEIQKMEACITATMMTALRLRITLIRSEQLLVEPLSTIVQTEVINHHPVRYTQPRRIFPLKERWISSAPESHGRAHVGGSLGMWGPMVVLLAPSMISSPAPGPDPRDTVESLGIIRDGRLLRFKEKIPRELSEAVTARYGGLVALRAADSLLTRSL